MHFFKILLYCFFIRENGYTFILFVLLHCMTVSRTIAKFLNRLLNQQLFDKVMLMTKLYWVISCPKCGHYTYTRFGTDRKKCPYCNTNYKIDKHITVDSRAKALEIIREKNKVFLKAFKEERG